jgi:protein tyrosine phosphatase (PTP) superfamily phosphohydrolase (DUF442 family)
MGRGLGMKFIKLPWRIQVQPKEAVMKDYLEALKKSEDGPFFVHCRRGAERTGVAEALYLYYNKGFSFDQAYEKSINGYHTLFYWRPFIKKTLQRFCGCDRAARESDSGLILKCVNLSNSS